MYQSGTLPTPSLQILKEGTLKKESIYTCHTDLKTSVETQNTIGT